MIRQRARQLADDEMRKFAQNAGWKVEDGKVVLPEGSLDREYNQERFISDTLTRHGIKVR